MSKLSYQCGWKSISLNEQKNQTISTRPLLLMLIMGKQKCLLLREVVSLSSKLGKKSNQNQAKSNHCLSACENLKLIAFSLKLKLLDDIHALLNPVMCLPLALVLVLRGKELSSRRGGSTMAAVPPGHRLGSSCTASRLCQTHHFLWCNPRSCTTEERTSGFLWRLSHEAVPLQ